MNYVAMQRLAHRQIARFGKKQVLRRGGTPRDCMAGILTDTKSDREGQLTQFGDLHVIISGFSLLGAAAPDVEQDVLVLEGVDYKILAPAMELAPDKVTILYWEVLARK